jgi:hypothetical protein
MGNTDQLEFSSYFLLAPKLIAGKSNNRFDMSMRKWKKDISVETLFIEPGSPWENGYNESFKGKFRDEHLNVEVFYTLKEAKIIIERWRHEYNTVRPHQQIEISTTGTRGPVASGAWF